MPPENFFESTRTDVLNLVLTIRLTSLSTLTLGSRIAKTSTFYWQTKSLIKLEKDLEPEPLQFQEMQLNMK